MKQKENSFIKLLSLITYKKKKQVKEFYLPEFNENNENRKENPQTTKIKRPVDPHNLPKKWKEKPGTSSETKKEKSRNTSGASDSTIATDIASNISYIKEKFNAPANKDIVIQEFTIAKNYKAFIAYLDGMVDRVTISNFILAALLQNDDKFSESKDNCQLDFILNNVVQTIQTKKIKVPGDMVFEILTGNTIIYVDSCDYYISCETKGYEKRPVGEPVVEGVVLGPHEAFNETMRTNITLIRKIIKSNDLTTEFLNVGDRNHNMCGVMYIRGLTNPALIDEVIRRIKTIKSDFVLGDGILEQYIEDSPFSILPTILTTERPDRTAAHLLEGKVAILTEGVPFAKIVPVTFPELMHSPEDSTMRWQFGTFLRFIRILSVFIATMLPGLYVAITNFHQEMIPTDLLIAIAKAKENVPFPTIVEILLMELSFELIREAGIRVPGIIGNTLGIIGALILGQAAVQANIVSPVLIIIVAVTGLGNFAVPNFSLAFGIRLIRFVFIFSAAFLGFFGIAVALVTLAAIMLNIKTFGVPFYTTASPKTRKSFDYILRWPIWKQELRPDYTNTMDVRRQPKISREWTQQDSHYTKPDKEGKND